MLHINSKNEILAYLIEVLLKMQYVQFYDISYPEDDHEWLKHDAFLIWLVNIDINTSFHCKHVLLCRQKIHLQILERILIPQIIHPRRFFAFDTSGYEADYRLLTKRRDLRKPSKCVASISRARGNRLGRDLWGEARWIRWNCWCMGDCPLWLSQIRVSIFSLGPVLLLEKTPKPGVSSRVLVSGRYLDFTLTSVARKQKRKICWTKC